MSKSVSRSTSLRKLRDFCAKPPQGMIANWWFNGLVNAFPLHFLLYTQFSTLFRKRQQGAKDAVKAKFDYRVRKLLEYPITEEEIELIEKIWDELDKLASLKKSINRN